MKRRSLVFRFLAIGLVFVANPLFAQTNSIWTGGNGLWSDDSNWSNGVPSGNFRAILGGDHIEITQDLPQLSLVAMEFGGASNNLILDEEMSITQSLAWDGGTIAGSESLRVMNHGVILSGSLDTTLNNFGRIDFVSAALAASPGNKVGPVWNNHPGSLLILDDGGTFGSSNNQLGSFNNSLGATIHQLQHAATYMIWNVANDGLIQIDDNAQVLFVNDFVQSETGSIHLVGPNSIVDMFGTSVIGGKIEGDGTVISALELHGVISPGQPDPEDPFGFLEIAGGLVMMPDSVLEVDIGNEADSISVLHHATVGGTINVTVHDGVSPGTYALVSATQSLSSNGTALGPLPKGVEASLQVDNANRQLQLIVHSVATIVAPGSIEVFSGVVRSGGAAELAESDNIDLSIARNSTQIQSVVEFTAKGFTSNQTPDSLSLKLEANVFARTNVVQTIELFNYNTETFELADSRSASRFLDQVTIVEPDGDRSRFVEPGTGCLEARIKFTSDANRQQFSANIDQTVWLLE